MLLLEAVIKLIWNSLYGRTTRKPFEKKYPVKSETWLRTNNEERVNDIELPFGVFVFRLTEDP